MLADATWSGRTLRSTARLVFNIKIQVVLFHHNIVLQGAYENLHHILHSSSLNDPIQLRKFLDIWGLGECFEAGIDLACFDSIRKR
jgi:hypothetical protein